MVERGKRGRAEKPPRRVRGRAKLEAGVRVWLVIDGQAVLGGGRVALLEAIAEEGSITAAARACGISYRAAWRWVDRLNHAAGEPLVETETGGAGGGGTHLTRSGLDAVRAYHLVERRAKEAIAAAVAEVAPPARRR